MAARRCHWRANVRFIHINPDGTESEAQGDILDAPSLRVQVPAIELALTMCMHDCKMLTDALGALVGTPMQGSKQVANIQHSSDMADKTARLLIKHVKTAIIACSAAVGESQPRLIVAHQILKQFYDMLRKVNIAKNSAISTGLARLWCQCTHVILHPDYSDMQKVNAQVVWVENSRKIFSAN